MTGPPGPNRYERPARPGRSVSAAPGSPCTLASIGADRSGHGAACRGRGRHISHSLTGCLLESDSSHRRHWRHHPGRLDVRTGPEHCTRPCPGARLRNHQLWRASATGRNFDPRHNARSESAQALVEALRRADGLVISTPSYHGGISGLIKNAFDFVEDLADDPRIYLDGRAVGCIVCAYGAQAMGSTLSSLRAMVHALRGWPTPYGATIVAGQGVFEAAADAGDSDAVRACHTVAEQVVEFARMKRQADPR